MKRSTVAVATAFAVGAACAAGVLFLSGAGAAPPNAALQAAEARLAALRQQIESTENQQFEHLTVVEFWERENVEQDSAMARLSNYTPGDPVGPILFDRARNLSNRAAFSLQDAKLRAFISERKVTQLKQVLAGTP